MRLFFGRLRCVLNGVGPLTQKVVGKEVHVFFQRDPGDQRLQVLQGFHISNRFIFIADISFLVERGVFIAAELQSPDGESERVNAREFQPGFAGSRSGLFRNPDDRPNRCSIGN